MFNLNTFFSLYMILSNVLFNSVVTKLKLEVSGLEEEKFYAKNLLTKVSLLKELKENNQYKSLSVDKKISDNENFFVMYIISISFLKANTTIHVSDIKGNIKLFYTAGSVNLTGKQKRQRGIAIARLISLLSKKSTFIGKKPIALHLTNVLSHKSLIVNKLKRNFFIQVVRSFNQAPYNGCRKKKIRRKKHTKITKK
jgi:ribosomal protein S11